MTQPVPEKTTLPVIRGVPLREVAPPLREVWLRFHEDGLCLEVDAVFVFQAQGMEVWCRINDERSYQRLEALCAPLKKDYRVDLYPTHADRERKPYSPDDDNPPPSFWTNAELRAYLRDPYYGRLGAVDVGGDYAPLEPEPPVDPGLKRRLKLFGDDIQEWAEKMRGLGADLPALAEAGYGPDAAPDIRNRARTVCLDHAKELGKCAGRLADNLAHALPRGKAQSGPPSQKERALPEDPFEGACAVSRQARQLAQRVMHFLYPQAHTVDLTDLRQPGLIDSLQSMQRMVSDFQTAARKAKNVS